MEWFPLKGKVLIKKSSCHHVSTKKKRLLLKGLVSTVGNDIYQKERDSGKNLKEWLPRK